MAAQAALDIALKNNIERIAGAILSEKELNPPNNFKFPCSICNKNCLKNQACIQCDTCDKFCHIKCDGTSLEKYKFYQTTNDDPNVKWHCLYCTMISQHKHIPFTLSDSLDLENLNNSDNMKFCEHLPNLEEIYETSKYSCFPGVREEELSLPSNLNSKYHSVYDFQKLKIQKNLNIFHANVNGLESKFDTLHNFLGGAVSAMDIIAITETSEHKDFSFLTNVDMDGYKLFHTATNSLKGGTALYINDQFDVFERNDLKAQTDLFESVWIEIKNKNSKNIVCGCVYRHPKNTSSDFNDFNKYMDSTLKKLGDENKELYICGDFNIDLLKINEVDAHLEFYNLLNGHCVLPFIVHQSRVVDRQVPSLIDNIFSNNINDFVKSGNIYLILSEHFSQFASVNHEKIDVREINMYGRDFSKFSEEKFREDVSIKTWCHNNEDPNLLMSDFVWRLDGCAERHAPTKKLKPNEVKLKLKPWITPDIVKLIKIRDKLFNREKDNQKMKELKKSIIELEIELVEN